MSFPGSSVVKNLPAIARDSGNAGSIPGSERSPGEGNGNLLQYSCLENSMDRGAWRATVHGVAKSQTWLKWLSTHARTHWWGSSDYRGLLGHCPRNSFLVWNSTSRKFPLLTDDALALHSHQSLSGVWPHFCMWPFLAFLPPSMYLTTWVIFFWLCHATYGILVLQPGIKLRPPEVEAWSPKHRTAREFLTKFLYEKRGRS